MVHHSERVCEVVKEALSTAPAPRQSLSGLTRPRGSIGGGTSKIRSPAKGGGLGRTSKLPAAPRKKVAIKTRTPALTAGRSLTTSRIARLSRAPPPPAPVTPKSRKGTHRNPSRGLRCLNKNQVWNLCP